VTAQEAVAGRTIRPPGSSDWPTPWRRSDADDEAERSAARHNEVESSVADARGREAMADWRSGGACFGRNDDAMFPETNREQREAAQLCLLACPVREECLSYALRADERWGVWGGTTEAERAKLRQAMRDEGVPAEEVAALVAAEQVQRYSLGDLQSGRSRIAPPFELIPSDADACQAEGCGNLGHKRRAGKRADLCQRHLRQRAARR
jgi:WhiB family redox-sensing transcriptional regulator